MAWLSRLVDIYLAHIRALGCYTKPTKSRCISCPPLPSPSGDTSSSWMKKVETQSIRQGAKAYCAEARLARLVLRRGWPGYLQQGRFDRHWASQLMVRQAKLHPSRSMLGLARS